MTIPRSDAIELLHPFVRKQFADLEKQLIANATNGKPLFLCFETYRSPERQTQVFVQGTSKVGPWRSPHQWGFAADFVPYRNGEWTWEVPDDEWLYLRAAAHQFGLATPIAWDRCHVEHPDWSYVRSRLRA